MRSELHGLTTAVIILLCSTSVLGDYTATGYSDVIYHSNQELTDVGIAGMVLGFVSLFGLMTFGLIKITMDQINNHKTYDAMLADARNKIQRLGMN